MSGAERIVPRGHRVLTSNMEKLSDKGKYP